MVKVLDTYSVIRQDEKKWDAECWLYVVLIIVSCIFIVISLLPGGSEVLGILLQNIGCSVMAASVMALFIKHISLKREEKQKKAFRYIYFSNLHHQMKRMFERLMWFDKALWQVDLNHNVDYYLTLDPFAIKAFQMELHSIVDYEKADQIINDLIKKYDKENWEDDCTSWDDVSKMFNIIGMASLAIMDEADKLKNERFLLNVNGIVEDKDISDILSCIDEFPRMLLLTDANYSCSVRFLWNAYKKISKICDYNDAFIVDWKPKDDLAKLWCDEKLHKATE